MEKFIFADGQDICLFSDGAVERFPSKFVENYKNGIQNSEHSKEWKYGGEGARFRGDIAAAQTVESRIDGVYLTSDEYAAVYAFSVNAVSGIYKRSFSDEKTPETHVINSVEYSFSGGCLDSANGRLATSLKRNAVNSDIAVFDLKNGSYVTVTGGDTQDTDPFYSPENANLIYFSSRGAGRDMNGEFVAFSPAAICAIDLSAMEVREVKANEKFSYFKPVPHGGKLYAIKAPAQEKRTNPFISFILIPYRILQAVANLLAVFIHAFTGKSVTSGGNNPAKGREYDSRKLYVRGNLINVEREAKKSKGKRHKDYGWVPLSWQLVEVDGDRILASGVADFDIAADGTIIFTDGKRIYSLKDGKKSKLCDAEMCLNLAFRHSAEKKDDLFSF